MAVVRSTAGAGLAHAATAGLVAGLGVAAAGAVHTAWDLFRKRGGQFAYLFEAQASLREG